jgi:hypothetical protein
MSGETQIKTVANQELYQELERQLELFIASNASNLLPSVEHSMAKSEARLATHHAERLLTHIRK